MKEEEKKGLYFDCLTEVLEIIKKNLSNKDKNTTLYTISDGYGYSELVLKNEGEYKNKKLPYTTIYRVSKTSCDLKNLEGVLKENLIDNRIKYSREDYIQTLHFDYKSPKSELEFNIRLINFTLPEDYGNSLENFIEIYLAKKYPYSFLNFRFDVGENVNDILVNFPRELGEDYIDDKIRFTDNYSTLSNVEFSEEEEEIRGLKKILGFSLIPGWSNELKEEDDLLQDLFKIEKKTYNKFFYYATIGKLSEEIFAIINTITPKETFERLGKFPSISLLLFPGFINIRGEFEVPSEVIEKLKNIKPGNLEERLKAFDLKSFEGNPLVEQSIKEYLWKI